MTDPAPATFTQAGTIPLKWIRRIPHVLLVTTRSGRGWTIPKGLIDPGMTAASTAVQETNEEAGVGGNLSPTPIGRYQYKKWGGVCDVVVFTLTVAEERPHWPEMTFRRRQWVRLEEAVGMIRHPALAPLLKEACLSLPPSDDFG